jgi:pimeloyl-ACP methyl ester carboxylesterase
MNFDNLVPVSYACSRIPGAKHSPTARAAQVSRRGVRLVHSAVPDAVRIRIARRRSQRSDRPVLPCMRWADDVLQEAFHAAPRLESCRRVTGSGMCSTFRPNAVMANEMRDHFVEVEGVRIHWAEVGKASAAPPVVLLHGLNNSCLSWSQVAFRLGTDRRVLMPDLPGHGQSDRPNAGYELDWYARIIARWLQTVGIEQADIVGHSFGGGIAQMLLLECPERIRRLVLVAAGGLGKGIGWWLRLASLPRVVEHLGQPFMALGTRLALRGAREGVTRQEIAELSRLNSRAGSARAFARSVRDVISWRGQRRNFLHRANEIEKLPAMLVVWGDRDGLIPIEQGRAFATLLEGAVFRPFEGCGHYLHNERPDAFVQILREFLDDPSVPATRLIHPVPAGQVRDSIFERRHGARQRT